MQKMLLQKGIWCFLLLNLKAVRNKHEPKRFHLGTWENVNGSWTRLDQKALDGVGRQAPSVEGALQGKSSGRSTQVVCRCWMPQAGVLPYMNNQWNPGVGHLMNEVCME